MFSCPCEKRAVRCASPELASAEVLFLRCARQTFQHWWCVFVCRPRRLCHRKKEVTRSSLCACCEALSRRAASPLGRAGVSWCIYEFPEYHRLAVSEPAAPKKRVRPECQHGGGHIVPTWSSHRMHAKEVAKESCASLSRNSTPQSVAILQARDSFCTEVRAWIQDGKQYTSGRASVAVDVFKVHCGCPQLPTTPLRSRFHEQERLPRGN